MTCDLLKAVGMWLHKPFLLRATSRVCLVDVWVFVGESALRVSWIILKFFTAFTRATFYPIVSQINRRQGVGAGLFKISLDTFLPVALWCLIFRSRPPGRPIHFHLAVPVTVHSLSADSGRQLQLAVGSVDR